MEEDDKYLEIYELYFNIGYMVYESYRLCKQENMPDYPFSFFIILGWVVINLMDVNNSSSV